MGHHSLPAIEAYRPRLGFRVPNPPFGLGHLAFPDDNKLSEEVAVQADARRARVLDEPLASAEASPSERGAALRGRDLVDQRSARLAMSTEKPAARKDDMAATTALPQPTRIESNIRFRDRVRVPDGRTGTVVGFYRTKSEMALVRFDDEESRKFPLSVLELAARNYHTG
jgi:hypothetical protein